MLSYTFNRLLRKFNTNNQIFLLTANTRSLHGFYSFYILDRNDNYRENIRFLWLEIFKAHNQPQVTHLI